MNILLEKIKEIRNYIQKNGLKVKKSKIKYEEEEKKWKVNK